MIKRTFKNSTLLVISSAIIFISIFTFSSESFARYMDVGGYSEAPYLTLYQFSYNSTWQPPMINAVYEWQTRSIASIHIGNSSNNMVYAGQYSWDSYGRYYHPQPANGSFTIYLNSRTISRDATNITNFIRFTMSHEIGHALWLADNPSTTQNSVMRYAMNPNNYATSFVQPYDVQSVFFKTY